MACIQRTLIFKMCLEESLSNHSRKKKIVLYVTPPHGNTIYTVFGTKNMLNATNLLFYCQQHNTIYTIFETKSMLNATNLSFYCQKHDRMHKVFNSSKWNEATNAPRCSKCALHISRKTLNILPTTLEK